MEDNKNLNIFWKKFVLLLYFHSAAFYLKHKACKILFNAKKKIKKKSVLILFDS